jgi:hypothetical protein
VDRKKKKKGKAAATPTATAGRLIVTYVDGTWSDNLEIARYRLELEAGELVLTLEVAPRKRPGKVRAAHQALRDFVANVDRVHTLQARKRALGELLRRQVLTLEHAAIGVRLSANGHNRIYPAGLVFGPDEVTVNLG